MSLVAIRLAQGLDQCHFFSGALDRSWADSRPHGPLCELGRQMLDADHAGFGDDKRVFEQMRICNRYYMSDIPGLDWLADFYITRNVHYIGAAIFLGLAFYVAFEFIMSKRQQLKLNASGWVRAVLLSAIVISGALIVIKNFPYVHFSDGFIIGFDLFHLAGVIAFPMTSMVCRIAKKKWAVGV